MEPYAESMIEERKALNEKTEKLYAFLYTAKFSALPEAERCAMQMQFHAMRAYEAALRMRIGVVPK